MKLQIPNLAERSLVNLSACGQMKSATKEIQEWAVKFEKRVLLYHFENPANVLGRLDVDNFETYVHVHLDVATKEFFAGRKLPKPSKDTPDLGEVLNPLVGQQISVNVGGVFSFSLTEMPNFWKDLANSGQKAKVLKMKSISFDLEGLPVDGISLAIDEKHGKGKITTRGVTEVKFSETYLMDCNNFIMNASANFIEKE